MVSEEKFRSRREQMVEQQLVARGIHDQRVLSVMRRVPRHEFLPLELSEYAYRDDPQPIGEHQTISQPYMVALMSQELRLTGSEQVLEIGTGSGYQTAILCELAHYVYTLERYPRLAEHAAEVLSRLGYTNVDLHVGDGSQGLLDMAPFDAILVTAAAPMLPGTLCSQLRNPDGRMIVPVGGPGAQMLQRVTRRGSRLYVENLGGVRFVPLIGRYGYKPTRDDPAESS